MQMTDKEEGNIPTSLRLKDSMVMVLSPLLLLMLMEVGIVNHSCLYVWTPASIIVKTKHDLSYCYFRDCSCVCMFV